MGLLFPIMSLSSMLSSRMIELEEKPATQVRRSKNSRWWMLPLLLPYLALLFPRIYARSTPALFGFPFFYWYQFAWVLLASAILAIVYRKLKV